MSADSHRPDSDLKSAATDTQTVVAALYCFVELPDFEDLRAPLLDTCQQLDLRGTLLLADEGINGTVAGTREAIDQLRQSFLTRDRFPGLTYKESFADAPPFKRMKVKLKREIVTMGVEGVNPNARSGERVDAVRWNALLADPDVLVIDTRNAYEHAIGTFPGAISPDTTTFREFPEFAARSLDPARHRQVAMFCTGGIRCEKATHLLLTQGFEQVFHLDGGILRYLEDVPADDNRWQGECFVFDDRVAVDARLAPGSYTQCSACRHPLSAADRADARYEPGVSCPHCLDSVSDDKRRRLRERKRQEELVLQRTDVMGTQSELQTK
ncbi:MAG: rhodanese-related sulfurtransferase [Pseudomonadota bacterium]